MIVFEMCCISDLLGDFYVFFQKYFACGWSESKAVSLIIDDLLFIKGELFAFLEAYWL